MTLSPHRFVDRNNKALAFRDFMDEPSLWNTQSSGVSLFTFSQSMEGITGKSRLEWTEGGAGNWGAAMFLPGDLVFGPDGDHTVHTRAYESNDSPGRGNAIGPAVNLIDNGPGIAPDGYYLFTYNNGIPFIEIVNVSSGGLFFAPVISLPGHVVHPGTLLSLSFRVVEPNHELTIYDDGFALTTVIIPDSMGDLFDGATVYPGIGGVPEGTDDQELTSWWYSTEVL
jgi:hypothetical protein